MKKTRIGSCASASRPAGPASRRGFAFVLVLMLLVLVTMVVGAFTMRTSAAYRASLSRAVSWRLYYAARAAVEETKATLWRQLITAKETPAILAPPDETTYDVGGVSVKVNFVDEAGKLPVNDFASPDDAKRKDLTLVLARLFDALALPSSTGLATAVRDYIDEDNDGLREMNAKNEPIFDACELLSIQGFRPEMLYRPVQEGLPPAADLLTTWYRGNVNVNSAGPFVLKSLSPRLTDADVQAIISARQDQPFKSPEDLAARCNVSGEPLADLARWAGFSTDTLTLKLEARQGDFVRRLEAVIWIESTKGHTLYFCDDWRGAHR